MRKMIVGLVAAVLASLGAGSAAAHPPLHWHCLQTPNGNWHLIASGVSDHAPHRALEQFHFNVHQPVFGVDAPGTTFDTVGKNPNGPVLLVFTPACP